MRTATRCSWAITGTGIVDPVFTIGDLSTVWLVAYVRESEAPKVRTGQQLDFTVLAYPKTISRPTSTTSPHRSIRVSAA